MPRQSIVHAEKDFEPLLIKLLRTFCLHPVHVYDNPAPPGWHLNSRIIPQLHFLLSTSGSFYYQVGSCEEVRCDPGDFVFVGPNVPHSCRLIDHDHHQWPHILTCRCELVTIQEQACETSVRLPLFGFILKGQSLPEQFLYLFHQLAETWRWSGHPLRQLRADALVVTLLSSLVRSVSPWSEAPPPVRRVLELIQRHPEHRYTLEELCALAGMSGKTLRRYVQLATGMSPSAFVIHCRMQKAHELLIETSQPLKAIASQLGYPDQYTFSHQFKKYFGQSPQAVRRNIY